MSAPSGSTSASTKTDARLQNLFVRQAIAQGIERDAMMEAVVRPITPDGQLLGNSVWVNSSDHYVDHFNGRFPYDPVAAEALLTGNGCVEGEDGIYECGGERLSFSWATTSGSEVGSPFRAGPGRSRRV